MSAPQSLPSPPFIPVAGMLNCRDLGGLPVAGQPGKITRHGLVFRSADPSKLTDDGVRTLQGLGITHVYDLRSTVELEKARAAEGWDKPKEWEGAARVFAPVFLDQDYSPGALAIRFRDYAEGNEGFVRAYSAIMAAAADASNPYAPFQRIFEHVAAPAPTPLLVHCKGGKDRTGVVCALLLSACGVDDEVVAHEYSLTELALAGRREGFVQHVTVQNDALRGDREGALNMISARKDAMLATLAMIRATYGSAERYMVEHCGLTPAAMEQIRRNLVVDAHDAPEQVSVDWRAHAKLVAECERT